MRKLIVAVAVLVAITGLVTGLWQVRAQGIRFTHVYDTNMYAQWGASIASGNTATGSQTITICPFFVNTPDGRQFTPYSTTTATRIDTGSISETLTPSAVSQVTPPSGYSNPQNACVNFTATFANAHAGSAYSTSQVGTGDAGVGEATADAAANGGGILLPILSTGSITPVATAAAIGTTAQTFTLTGATASSNVTVVSQPVPSSLCPMVAARATATNTVSLYFTTLTAVACTPTAGTYTFIASR